MVRMAMIRMTGVWFCAALLGGALLMSSAQAAGPVCGLNNGKVATGKPIPIGSINGVTGPDDFSSSAKSAAAYFKCVNANGGINGRPVDYITADDQWRPETAAAVAAKLVKDDHVVAMIGSNSIIECGVNAPLYDRENVVVIDIGVVHECFTSKNIAPVNEGPRVGGVGMERFAADHLGVKKMACLGWNLPGSREWLCGGFVEWGKLHGVEVRTYMIDPSSSDYTSALLQAAEWKPDAILLCFTKGGIMQALSAAEDQDMGDKIKFMSLASGYVVGLPKAIGDYWNNRFWTEMEFTPLDGTGPDNRNWHAIMDKYGSPSDPRDTFSQGGYLAAKIATQAMLKLDPAKIDRATVADALRAVTNFHSDMMCGPWYFGNGPRHNANHVGMVSIAKDGRWKPDSQCFNIDDPELKDILSSEKTAAN